MLFFLTSWWDLSRTTCIEMSVTENGAFHIFAVFMSASSRLCQIPSAYRTSVLHRFKWSPSHQSGIKVKFRAPFCHRCLLGIHKDYLFLFISLLSKHSLTESATAKKTSKLKGGISYRKRRKPFDNSRFLFTSQVNNLTTRPHLYLAFLFFLNLDMTLWMREMFTFQFFFRMTCSLLLTYFQYYFPDNLCVFAGW